MFTPTPLLMVRDSDGLNETFSIFIYV